MSGKMNPRTLSHHYDSVEMERHWKTIFDKYDVDKDGKIPLNELKILLTSSIQSDLQKDFAPEVIQEILEWADLNDDGQLCYEEFLRMVYARELGDAHPKFQRLVRLAAFTVVPQSQQAITVRKYIEEYNCVPPPVFMFLISLIEIIVFIYYCVEMKELSESGPVPFHSPMIYNPWRRYEAWRYLTYMLIHAGGVHIFFNLLIQLMLGIPLEMVHKWWRIMLVYFAGVIAGSLGSSIADPYTFLCGASGGVYALIAAHLANVIINFKEMTFGCVRLISLLIFGGMDIGLAIYSRYDNKNVKNQTSYAAHIAGSLAGLMVGINCLRNLRVHKWENVIGWIFLAIYVLLMLFAILWNIFYSDYYPPNQ